MTAVAPLAPSPPDPNRTLIALLDRLSHERRSATVVGCVEGHPTVRAEVQRGAIVYVAVAGGPYLSDRIVADCDVTRDELARAVQHCRLSGRRLGEQLLFEGKLTPRQLQQALRDHNRDQLQRSTMLGPDIVWDVFDQAQSFGEMFTYSLVELCDERTPRRPAMLGDAAANG